MSVIFKIRTSVGVVHLYKIALIISQEDVNSCVHLYTSPKKLLLFCMEHNSETGWLLRAHISKRRCGFHTFYF